MSVDLNNERKVFCSEACFLACQEPVGLSPRKKEESRKNNKGVCIELGVEGYRGSVGCQ
jgi:hypothetical protein